jgi:predicted DsbA family dithiol-disulfide isomerase
VEIEIYSDVVCPWCWIGEKRLLKALEGSAEPVNITWRAFQLDPTSQSNGEPTLRALSRKFGGEQRVRGMFAHVTEVAKGEGLTMDFDHAITANTRDAHRLIWWAGQRGDQRPMVEALHAAHFSHGQNIGSIDVLAAVAGGLGHDEQEVLDFLKSDAGVPEVDAELSGARELGISSVPTFIFAGKYSISGAQDPATIREVLDEVRRREAASPITPLVPSARQGEACEDDTCAT